MLGPSMTVTFRRPARLHRGTPAIEAAAAAALQEVVRGYLLMPRDADPSREEQ